MSPKLTAAAALLLGGLALTACSSSAPPSPGRAAQPPSSAAPSSDAPSPGAPSPVASSPVASSPAAASPAPSGADTGAPSGAGGGPGGTAGGSTGAAGAAECTASQLTVVQTDPSVGAGQYDSTLLFTNTSGHTCSLTGYPGVSYVPEGNGPAGNPATRTGAAYRTVMLAPGGTAHATFHDANGVSGYDPGQCLLTPATGLKVYPPDQRTALFLPWKTEHCAGQDVHAATIGPITG